MSQSRGQAVTHPVHPVNPVYVFSPSAFIRVHSRLSFAFLVALHRGTQQVTLAVMLTDYIERLMRKAVYDKLEDGSFSGRIPLCPGVIAFGRSLSSCQQELQESLEGWMLVKLRHGDPLPVLGRINLNRTPVFSRKNDSHAKSQAL